MIPADEGRRCVVITPARDEADHIRSTLESMVGQELRPVRWVIVNDGSSDDTAEIVQEYCDTHPWIRRVDRPDRGRRVNGSGVMEAVFAGLDALDVEDWDYLVKLDADLSFGPGYLSGCIQRFEDDSRLGIGGGIVLSELDGRLVGERHPEFHVRGATKIYRRACWDAIGGLHPVKGWDSLDELKATMSGWQTSSFPELSVVQHRYTGAASGQMSNWRKNGEACWIIGYHPAFLAARALTRGLRRPYLTASLGLVWGYGAAARRHVPPVDDPELVRYIRDQQRM